MLLVSIFGYTHSEHIECQASRGLRRREARNTVMKQTATDTVVNLIAVIVAVTDETPRVLIIDQDADSVGGPARPALPNGPFEPGDHPSLESSLRRWVEAQTGLDLYYVEQLYTFGNRFRDAGEIEGGPRVVSVAYIALTHEDSVDTRGASWRDWYSFLPWEDWRDGRPAVLDEHIEPSLQSWARAARSETSRRERQERMNVTFSRTSASDMDAVLSLERYELLYEAGLVAEAIRDQNAVGDRETVEDAAIFDNMGSPLASDHRRILATALGRLRGKLAYRPVVFDLLPGEFTLLQLQRVVEALSGDRLHKQNFRRLVISADLVEAVGRTSTVGRGRPAELFRFRREVLGEKLTVGVARPVMRSREG